MNPSSQFKKTLRNVFAVAIYAGCVKFMLKILDFHNIKHNIYVYVCICVYICINKIIKILTLYIQWSMTPQLASNGNKCFFQLSI